MKPKVGKTVVGKKKGEKIAYNVNITLSLVSARYGQMQPHCVSFFFVGFFFVLNSKVLFTQKKC